ncbi:MAG: hypothetical protein J7L95_01625 [Prolixibacteraceae bacterium]|nr:hypothetical protein [Prolixibacteraceae bacterium]
MRITIVHNSKIPVFKYGGIERVIWDLGYELAAMGHKITYLVKEKLYCPFVKVKFLTTRVSLNKQIPLDTDLVHLHFQPGEEIQLPHLITVHGNLPEETIFDPITNFVSQNHARRYGAEAFVYNGLDWNLYGNPDFTAR